MHTQAAFKPSIIVILDPCYGALLQELPFDVPAWVVMSPINAPVVTEIWAIRQHESHLTGITGMTFEPDMKAEDFFIDQREFAFAEFAVMSDGFVHKRSAEAAEALAR